MGQHALCHDPLHAERRCNARTPGFYARKNRRFIKTLSLSLSLSSRNVASFTEIPFISLHSQFFNLRKILSNFRLLFFFFFISCLAKLALFKIVTREKKISSRILHSHALKARIRTRETRGKVEGVETGSNRQNIRFLLDLDRSYCTNLSIQIREQYTYTRKINKSFLRI